MIFLYNINSYKVNLIMYRAYINAPTSQTACLCVSIFFFIFLSCLFNKNLSAAPLTITESPIIDFMITTELSTYTLRKTRANPLRHKLDSGLQVKGIKLSNNIFITKQHYTCGHNRLALSLNYNQVLYEMGLDKLTMTMRF